MSDHREAIAEVLAAHQRVLDVAGSCTCGSWPPPGRDVPWPDHLAGALADLLAAERQRGREEALREAGDAWQMGEWTVLTSEIKAASDNIQRVIGAAQVVTDWLRARGEGPDGR